MLNYGALKEMLENWLFKMTLDILSDKLSFTRTATQTWNTCSTWKTSVRAHYFSISTLQWGAETGMNILYVEWFVGFDIPYAELLATYKDNTHCCSSLPYEWINSEGVIIITSVYSSPIQKKKQTFRLWRFALCNYLHKANDVVFFLFVKR